VLLEQAVGSTETALREREKARYQPFATAIQGFHLEGWDHPDRDEWLDAARAGGPTAESKMIHRTWPQRKGSLKDAVGKAATGPWRRVYVKMGRNHYLDLVGLVKTLGCPLVTPLQSHGVPVIKF
jgi:hypothetical protein